MTLVPPKSEVELFPLRCICNVQDFRGTLTMARASKCRRTKWLRPRGWQHRDHSSTGCVVVALLVLLRLPSLSKKTVGRALLALPCLPLKERLTTGDASKTLLLQHAYNSFLFLHKMPQVGSA